MLKVSDLDVIFDWIGMAYDPRTHHLVLVNLSPFLIIWYIFNFLAFANYLGPAIMKNRQPYNIRGVMFFYNVIMTFFNLYAVYRVIPLSNYFTILLDFEYPDRTDMSEHAIYLIHLGYLYLLTKLCDCFDTLFFVLRKKYNQITFLHVYHHTVVPVFGYLLLRINPLLPACYLFVCKYPKHIFCFMLQFFRLSHSIKGHQLELFNEILLLHCSCQLFGSCRDVLVLRPVGLRARNSEVSMVEKVHYHTAAMAVCHLRHLRLHCIHLSTQLSHVLDVFCHDTAANVLLHVL